MKISIVGDGGQRRQVLGTRACVSAGVAGLQGIKVTQEKQ